MISKAIPVLAIAITLFNCIQAREPRCPPVDGATPTYFPHENCSLFYQCSNGVPYVLKCPIGLYFNPELNVCDAPANVKCSQPNPHKPASIINDRVIYDDGAVGCNRTISGYRPFCPIEDGDLPVFIPHEDCTKYYECSHGQPILMCCPPGLYFNPELNVCDRPENVDCDRFAA